MKTIFLFASISIASGLLLVNVYTSLVDAKSWGSNIPVSIATAREYFETVNPGNFFRVFSPVNQLLGLAALIFCWRSSPVVRLSSGAALVLYILADVFTFAYFYPRNEIMFKTASLTDINLLKKTCSEWSTMNWLRTLLLLAGLLLSFQSFHKIYILSTT